MRRSLLGLVLFGGAACIDIPPNIHAEFAPPAPQDRSNFRPGIHGSALPLEDVAAVSDAGAPQAKAAEVSVPSADAGAEGGAP